MCKHSHTYIPIKSKKQNRQSIVRVLIRVETENVESVNQFLNAKNVT